MNATVIERVTKKDKKYKNLILAEKLIDVELPRIINNACSLLKSLNEIKVISLLYKIDKINISKNPNHIFNKMDLIDESIEVLLKIIELKEVDNLIFNLNNEFVVNNEFIEREDFDITEFRKILLRIKTSFPSSILTLKNYDCYFPVKKYEDEMIRLENEIKKTLLKFTSFYDEVIPVIDFFYKTL